MIPDPVKHIEDLAKNANTFTKSKTKGVFERYPILFSSLIIFGVVAVMHGFESIIEYVPFFHEHPGRVFIIGLTVLIFTGSLYKKLNQKFH